MTSSNVLFNVNEKAIPLLLSDSVQSHLIHFHLKSIEISNNYRTLL